MIKKLRRKLIAACMLSLAVVLLVILGGVNLVSYQKVVADADNVLSMLASVALSLLGLLAVLMLLLILSHRIVRPVAESYEKQKQFITDAGHELKTPMTIISADADLLEMECGENQWLTDIRRQAQRLTGLTNDLIYLSRMEEEQPKLQVIQFPLSDLAEEMAQSFAAPAQSQGKELEVSVQPMLSCTGDEKAIRQLISILLDNALKYSPQGGKLALKLEKQGRNVLLTVSNTTTQPMERDKLSTSSTAFTAPTSPAAARPGATAWGCPSPGASCWPTREKSGRRAPTGPACLWRSPCRDNFFRIFKYN